MKVVAMQSLMVAFILIYIVSLTLLIHSKTPGILIFSDSFIYETQVEKEHGQQMYERNKEEYTGNSMALNHLVKLQQQIKDGTNNDGHRQPSEENFVNDDESVDKGTIVWNANQNSLNIQTKEHMRSTEMNAQLDGKGYPVHNVQQPTKTLNNQKIKTEMNEDERHDHQPTDNDSGNIRMDSDERRKCKPVKNVVFLKTHKTGSSTVLNIFQRFTQHHKLQMALPMVNKGTHLFKWPRLFNKSAVFEYKEGQKYNIVANHARFSKAGMLEVMSDVENTKFVTILRDPLFQFESMFSYFKINKSLGMDNIKNVHDFLRVVEKDRRPLVERVKFGKLSIAKLLSKNPNAHDLGYDPWLETPSQISKIVDTVQKDFNLVMISDYMLESLVLLKDELCWDLEDVVYFTLNKRPDQFRHSFEDVVRERNIMKKWSRIDHTLYQQSNDTMWKKIESKGGRFKRDVAKLREMNKALEKKCIDHGTHYDKAQPWFPILGYKIKKEARGEDYFELCKQITRTEIDYTLLLGEEQSKANYTMPKKYRDRIENVF